MKFDRLQDLIDYCARCPVCQNERELSISVGPDTNLLMGPPFEDETDLTKLKSFQRNNNQLVLKVEARVSQYTYRITFTINTLTNELITSIPTPQHIAPGEQAADRASHPEMFFYLYARCDECGSGINTEDIILDILDKKVRDLFVEQETRLVRGNGGYFELDYFYAVYTSRNTIEIRFVRHEGDDCNYTEFYVGGNESVVSIPLTEFDFSDQEKLFARLQTLMLFS
jgi:hypothetical protein